jgi:hypothetical protein
MTKVLSFFFLLFFLKQTPEFILVKSGAGMTAFLLIDISVTAWGSYMPEYDYVCSKCGKTFTIFLSFRDLAMAGCTVTSTSALNTIEGH